MPIFNEVNPLEIPHVKDEAETLIDILGKDAAFRNSENRVSWLRAVRLYEKRGNLQARDYNALVRRANAFYVQ